MAVYIIVTYDAFGVFRTALQEQITCSVFPFKLSTKGPEHSKRIVPEVLRPGLRPGGARAGSGG